MILTFNVLLQCYVAGKGCSHVILKWNFLMFDIFLCLILFDVRLISWSDVRYFSNDLVPRAASASSRRRACKRVARCETSE